MKSTISIIVSALIAVVAVFYAGSFYGRKEEQNEITKRINTVNKERADNDKKVLDLSDAERCAILGGRLFSDWDCR